MTRRVRFSAPTLGPSAAALFSALPLEPANAYPSKPILRVRKETGIKVE